MTRILRCGWLLGGRIFIGFHFRKSVVEGTEYGRKIGNRAANLYLRPVH